MNGILYFLIGGSVAAVIALAFFQKRGFGTIGSTDMIASAAFLSGLAAATCILIYSPWGRRLTSRLQRKANDEDERVRRDARTKGLVRKPPTGPLP
jgi:hypothetical protein